MNPGTSGDLELINDKKYTIGISIAMAPGKFKRTKVVTFSSRYVIMNHCDCPVSIRQYHSAEVVTIAPNKQLSFYWPEVQSQTAQICITTDANVYDWSIPLKVDALGELPVKLTKKKTKEPIITNVNIVQELGSIFIVISKPEKPPYLIDNELNMDISVSQVVCIMNRLSLLG